MWACAILIWVLFYVDLTCLVSLRLRETHESLKDGGFKRSVNLDMSSFEYPAFCTPMK